MKEGRVKIKELEVIVADVIHEAHDTTTLVLFTGNDELHYEPGHFLTIEPHQFPGLQRWVAYLEDIKGKKEPSRAYSISSSPDEKHLAITIKEERYISGHTPYPPLLSPILARRTFPGTRMVITGFTGPYTLNDNLRSASEELVHICAGSGIVPSFSIIKHDLRVNEKLRHKLIYSNKYFDDIIFYNQLNDLQKEFPDRLSVTYTLTREENKNNLERPGIIKGRVSKTIIEQAVKNTESTSIFACGPDHTTWQKREAKKKGAALPNSFMETVLDNVTELGVPKNRIKKESYG